MLYKVNVSYYGGVSNIAPLPLDVFRKMVSDSHKAAYIPEPKHIKRFFEKAGKIASTCSDEKAWFQGITNEALNWLG